MSVYLEKGSRTYVIDFTLDGQRYRENSGVTSKKVAKELEIARKAAFKENRAGYKRRERPQLLSVDAQRWFDGKSKLSPRSRRIERYNLGHLLGVLGKIRSVDITPEDILRYQEARKAEGASNRTVSLELGTLRAILKRQGCWNVLQKGMADAQVKLSMPEREEPIGHSLTYAEEEKLLDACSKSRSRSLRVFVELALQTGARYETLRTLQWGAVDFGRRTVKIGKDKTRASSNRIVPLTQRALAVLEVWAANFPDRQPEHYVFASELVGFDGEDGHLKGSTHPYKVDPTKPMGSWKTAWNTARKLSGVRVRTHDARHTFVTRAIERGVPITMVGEIVGWSKNSMVAMATRYCHPDEDSKRRAMETATSGDFPTSSGDLPGKRLPVFPLEMTMETSRKVQ